MRPAMTGRSATSSSGPIGAKFPLRCGSSDTQVIPADSSADDLERPNPRPAANAPEASAPKLRRVIWSMVASRFACEWAQTSRLRFPEDGQADGVFGTSAAGNHQCGAIARNGNIEAVTLWVPLLRDPGDP